MRIIWTENHSMKLNNRDIKYLCNLLELVSIIQESAKDKDGLELLGNSEYNMTIARKLNNLIVRDSA